MKKCMIFILFIGFSLLFSCVGHQNKAIADTKSVIIGEWLGSFLVVADSLFKDKDDKSLLKLIFENNNEMELVLYELKEEKNINIISYFKGYYRIKNNKITFFLGDKEEGTYPFTLSNNELVIDGGDGITFKLKRIL